MVRQRQVLTTAGAEVHFDNPKIKYIMNRIKWILPILAAVLLAPGCFFDFDDDDDNFLSCVNGRGQVVTETFTLPAFDAIQLNMAAEVFISQGSQQEVSIEAQKNIIDRIRLTVREREWKIEPDRCLRDFSDVRIFITVPDIRKIELNGSGRVFGENTFHIDDIELGLPGSGTIDLALNCDDINARISGSGTIALEGNADELDFTLSGSGRLKAFGLTLREADVLISGSGNAEVRVTNRLSVRISGSGDVLYRGNPSLNVNITGSGRVIDSN